MDLFSLSAKLLLDLTDYEKNLKRAEQLGEGMGDVDVSVTADASGATTEINELKSTVDGISDVELKPTANVTDAKTNLGSLKSDAQELNGKQVTVDGDADISDGQTNLTTLENDADNLDSKQIEIDADADISAGQTNLNTLQSDANDLDGKQISVDGDADITSGQSNLQTLESDADDLNGKNVTIGANADTEPAATSLSGLAGSLASIVGSSGNMQSALSTLVGSLAGGTLAKAFMDIANAIWEAVDAAAQTGDSIQKGAIKLGVSYQDYQDLDAMLQLNNTSAAAQQRTFKTIESQIQAARENPEGEAAQMFADLNIGIDDKTSSGDIFWDIIEAFGTNQNFMNKYAGTLLGSGYFDLKPLIASVTDYDENNVSAYQRNWNTVSNMVHVSDEAIDASADLLDAEWVAKQSEKRAGANRSYDTGLMGAKESAYTAKANWINGVISQEDQDAIMQAVNSVGSDDGLSFISAVKNDANTFRMLQRLGLSTDAEITLANMYAGELYEGYDLDDVNALAAEVESAMTGVQVTTDVDTDGMVDQIQSESPVAVGVTTYEMDGATSDDSTGTSRWGGLDYVPYDGYKATLHEGETILNSNAADAYRGGNSNIVAALQEALSQASFNMNGKAVGRITAGTVDRTIGKSARAGRYR